jgi:long-chain acyl-CoA synthetase
MTTPNATTPDVITPTKGSLEYWAAEKPDAVAVIEDGVNLTYRAWNVLADALAEGLTRRGVVAGDIIVTRLQIRKEWPIIGAAAAKLGCSVLGLNWRLTPAEAHYVLSNSRANVMICDDPAPASLTPAFAGLPIKFAVSVDQPAMGFVNFADLVEGDRQRSGLFRLFARRSKVPQRFSKREAPLIIYTSGTTGLPKGVDMSTFSGDPKELMEYLQDFAKSRPQIPGDIVLVSMPMHHGAGPGLVRQCLTSGNTMILQRRFDPVGTLELIQRHKVSFWTGVPTMYKRLAGLPEETFRRYDVSSIRTLGVGAAPVTPALKTWITDHFGDCLHEGYGATELGMISSLSPDMQKLKPGSSGLPHKHVHIRIRDDSGRDLPTGSTGEIWIKTPVTIRNYVNADRLGPDTLDADGFFRIGDVGHLDEDGHIFITDRAKDMIIAGGVNIYPAEIEAALLKHPAVQDAAVIGIPDDEFGEQVKAYLELKPGVACEPAAVLAATTPHLASYKLPKSIEVVAELPRNTMGKVMKRQLREPYWVGRERKV